MEMSVYSKLFQSLAKGGAPKAGGEGAGTQSAGTFGTLALRYLDEAYNKVPFHYMKLVRNVGKLVKTAFTKGLQDFFR